MKQQPVLVLISCADTNEAEYIGSELLKNKNAECAQTLNGIDSMYLWPPKKNTVDYAKEALLLVKTLDNKWNELEKTVRKLHSYENPEIIALPMTHVSKDYLAWMTAELTP